MNITLSTPLSAPRTIFKIGLPLLCIALAGLAYTAWQSWVTPMSGYGDDAAAMQEIRQADPRELSGGDMTNFHQGFKPFEQAASNLPWQWMLQFDAGDGLIKAKFSPALASGERPDRDGVGPHFNANACASCHVSDGRSAPPVDPDKDSMLGMFLRLSVPDGNGGWMPPKGYASHQLHDRAVPGVPVEGVGKVRYVDVHGSYEDGSSYTLSKPYYHVENPAYGALPANTVIEARVSPPLHGLGLLEAIDDRTLLALAAAKPDGVSGKPNYLINPETGQREIGRFSWKANAISLRLQTAGAFFNDMGVTTTVFNKDGCGNGQTACQQARSGAVPGETEVSAEALDNLTKYLQLLSVPARRDVANKDVVAGEALFKATQCVACHVATLKTGDDHPLRRLRNQTIHPYTDLLLHDMGPALAGRVDGEANRQEWRTPPLWGIGLTQRSNGHTRFLHDGRARNLEEAILWHGGEADAARARFIKLSKTEREQILAFLGSL